MFPTSTDDNEEGNTSPEPNGNLPEYSPNDSIEAPQSDWFQKSEPNDNIEAPKSMFLMEGFDFLKTPPPDEDE